MKAPTDVSDEIEVLKLVTARLEAAAIAYMVTGSLALSHYAQPRMTRDIDLGVAIGPHDVERFAEALWSEFECDVERELHDERPDALALRGRGVAAVYRSDRIKTSK